MLLNQSEIERENRQNEQARWQRISSARSQTSSKGDKKGKQRHKVSLIIRRAMGMLLPYHSLLKLDGKKCCARYLYQSPPSLGALTVLNSATFQCLWCRQSLDSVLSNNVSPNFIILMGNDIRIVLYRTWVVMQINSESFSLKLSFGIVQVATPVHPLMGKCSHGTTLPHFPPLSYSCHRSAWPFSQTTLQNPASSRATKTIKSPIKKHKEPNLPPGWAQLAATLLQQCFCHSSLFSCLTTCFCASINPTIEMLLTLLKVSGRLQLIRGQTSQSCLEKPVCSSPLVSDCFLEQEKFPPPLVSCHSLKSFWK